jgi:hypothetical protein
MEKQNSYTFNFSIFLLKISSLVLIIGIPLNFALEHYIIFKTQITGASKVNKILSVNLLDEIPIFGSSRAQQNFVPSIINDNCYNYGIDGIQSNIWLFFLEQELKKNKNTPIIINYDLLGLIFSDGDLGNYIPNWFATKDILENNGEFYYWLPLIKYYGRYQNYLKEYVNEKINFTRVTDKGGGFQKMKQTESQFQKGILQRRNEETVFHLNEDLLLKFNELVNSTNRKIILVISPYHKSNFIKFQNIEIANKYLNSLSKKDNIEVIDLRNYIVDEKLFYDTKHLNYNGAIKFSKKLKELLSYDILK